MNRPGLHIRCATLDEARRVVSLLLSRKIPPKNIEVLSGEPIHDVGASVSGKSRLPVFVLTGAVLGIAAGYGLAAATARLYPINTGGMPIVSPLPVGIVTYEMMMLMAILFTLAGMLWEGKLLRKQPRDPTGRTHSFLDDEVLIIVRGMSAEEIRNLQAAADLGAG
jgi:Alternative complex III, ActD subunit